MKTALAITFPLLVLGVFLASFWYVAYRLRSLLGLNRRWLLRIGVTVTVFAAMAAMLSAARSTSLTVGVLNVIGGYVFSFYVFLLLALLVLHALERMWKPFRKWSAWSALALALGSTTAGALWASPFGVTENAIVLDGLEKDVTIMHLSDVHIGHHRGKEHLEKIVAETNRHKPDLVLINGDLVDSNVALLPGVLAPLADFQAPVYFVGGNHETYMDNARALALLKQHGVRTLHNQVVHTHGIQLVGLDYMKPDNNTFDMHPSTDTRTIQNVLPTLAISNGMPAVLMHHSPVGARYAAATGIDLMLAGHTHAGQMFPGTLFAPLIFPFNAGLYKLDDMRVFVSQGAGTFGPRMRLGTSNEINLLRLKATGTTTARVAKR
jgi:predicted MPP superfamily phosphohydrolase